MVVRMRIKEERICKDIKFILGEIQPIQYELLVLDAVHFKSGKRRNQTNCYFIRENNCLVYSCEEIQGLKFVNQSAST